MKLVVVWFKWSDLFDMDLGQLVINLVIGGIIFLIIREIVLWYWKINVMVRKQDELVFLLNRLVLETLKLNPNEPDAMIKNKLKPGEILVVHKKSSEIRLMSKAEWDENYKNMEDWRAL